MKNEVVCELFDKVACCPDLNGIGILFGWLFDGIMEWLKRLWCGVSDWWRKTMKKGFICEIGVIFTSCPDFNCEGNMIWMAVQFGNGLGRMNVSGFKSWK